MIIKNKKAPIVLVDYDGIICKAFYAALAEDALDKAEGILIRIVSEIKHAYPKSPLFLIASKQSYKKTLYPTYKAKRSKNKLLKVFKDYIIQNYEGITIPTFEADDIIILLKDCFELVRPNREVIIISDDKDMHNLHNKCAKIKEPKKLLEFNPNVFFEQLLKGDKEDNVKGIPNIGSKRAAKLLQEEGGQCTIATIARIYKKLGQSIDNAIENINLIMPLTLKYCNIENTEGLAFYFLSLFLYDLQKYASLRHSYTAMEAFRICEIVRSENLKYIENDVLQTYMEG